MVRFGKILNCGPLFDPVVEVRYYCRHASLLEHCSIISQRFLKPPETRLRTEHVTPRSRVQSQKLHHKEHILTNFRNPNLIRPLRQNASQLFLIFVLFRINPFLPPRHTTRLRNAMEPTQQRVATRSTVQKKRVVVRRIVCACRWYCWR